MIVINKNTLLSFLLGIILCGGVVYGVNVYESKAIKYDPIDASWDVNNVGDAINSLYNMKQELENIKSLGDAAPSDIATGKTAVVQGELVEGTSTSTTMSRLYAEFAQSNGATSKSWTHTATGTYKLLVHVMSYHDGNDGSNTITATKNGSNISASKSMVATNYSKPATRIYLVSVNEGDKVVFKASTSYGEYASDEGKRSYVAITAYKY